MYMDEGWDTGDIGICREFTIPRDACANAGWLQDSLARVGAELMVHFLRLLEEGQAPRNAQDHSRASYAPKISRDELEIDWRRPASKLFDTVRGLAPDPCARTTFNGQQLRVLSMRELGEGQGQAQRELGPKFGLPLEPGTVLLGPGDAVIVVCGGEGQERVVLDEVQPPGKRRMTGAEFARGRRISSGARLGS